MPFRIVRNDITRMDTDAIVNTANAAPIVGPGCDSAVYNAAGYDELLRYRTEKIGYADEGEVFITPGFMLKAKYIIHAVSPYFIDGDRGEEEKLRSCYRKSLQLARNKGLRSVAFPLISTGSFGYPREEGMRIAVDEIHAFLLKNDPQNDMDVILVVFTDSAVDLGARLYPDLERYIDRNYVEAQIREEYGWHSDLPSNRPEPSEDRRYAAPMAAQAKPDKGKRKLTGSIFIREKKSSEPGFFGASMAESACAVPDSAEEAAESIYPFEAHESKLEERMRHLSDTFSQYLMYLIKNKNMENADVYKRAIVDKKTFSKIKNNADYHPQKLTALCLCVGARLNLDEAKDLLARAGYALSPCDKVDVIFSYFIENEIYDMIELDIQLEEHGLPCIIS